MTLIHLCGVRTRSLPQTVHLQTLNKKKNQVCLRGISIYTAISSVLFYKYWYKRWTAGRVHCCCCHIYSLVKVNQSFSIFCCLFNNLNIIGVHLILVRRPVIKIQYVSFYKHRRQASFCILVCYCSLIFTRLPVMLNVCVCFLLFVCLFLLYYFFLPNLWLHEYMQVKFILTCAASLYQNQTFQSA